MAAESERAAARVHWLVAARFGASPSGESFEVSARTLDAELARRVPSIEVEVPDRLGGGERRRLSLPVAGLATFTLNGVIAAVPELKARLASAGASRAERAAAEAAAYGTALDVLRSAPVARVEGAWRGLLLLAERCPKGADMHVEAIDVEPAALPATLAARPASDAFEDPDAVLVAEPVADAAVLATLADAAEGLLAPAIAEVAPSLLGAADAEDLSARLERGGRPAEAWEGLRSADGARWLCGAMNRVALFSEGAGAYKRTAFGSPVWALGAMLADSYRSQGAFAAVVGPAHALASPAGWVIPSGSGQGVRAPTEVFLPIAAQGGLARAGLVGLGSPRNADRVVLAAAPTASSAPDAQALPAQLLTGRIVRFARWARAQLDPAADAASVQAILEQAAGVFLFPALGEAAKLTARVEGEGSARSLRVAARVAPTHAGAPFAIEFALPL